jgi:DNA repair protein RadC
MPTRGKTSDGAMGTSNRFSKHRHRTTPGHRQRLRERFRKGGSDAMPDCELLELVLFRALPLRDTKELAKQLIARFGSFAEVVNAPDQRLKGSTGSATASPPS